MYQKEKYPEFKQGLILLLILFVLQILLAGFYGLMVTVTDVIPFEVEVKILEYLILFLLGPIFAIGYTIKFACDRADISLKDTIGKKVKSGSIYLYTTFLVVGLSIVMSEVDNFIMSYLPEELAMEEMFVQLLDNNLFIVLISVGIIAPILEEILFRGIILKGFLKNYTVWKAITFSSLIFAIAHFNLRQGIVTFLMGFFLGWLYFKTKSLILPIFAHIINNSLAVFAFHFMNITGYSEVTPAAKEYQPLWLTLTGVFLILAGYYLFKQWCQQSKIVEL